MHEYLSAAMKAMKLYPWYLWITPIITNILNIQFSEYLYNKENVAMTILFKVLLEFVLIKLAISDNVIEKYQHNFIHYTYNVGIILSKDKYNEINRNIEKTYSFIRAIPYVWSTLISIIFIIMRMPQYKIAISIIGILTGCIIYYIDDKELYNIVKPDSKSVIWFYNEPLVNIKLANGAEPDPTFWQRRDEKRNKQYLIEQVIIIFVELIIIYMIYDDTLQIWLVISAIGSIYDMTNNIESFTYYDIFLETEQYLNIMATNPKKSGYLEFDDEVRTVEFNNVSFGYFNDNEWDLKIRNYSNIFTPGIHICTNKNGAGKSTFFKSLIYNLPEGKILINGLDKSTFTRQSLSKLIYYITQSTECNVELESQEILWGANPELEDQLCLPIGKSMSAMSGGEKKRTLILMGLISNCPIMIFDEALSELSADMKSTVMNILLKQKNKVIFIAEHGIDNIVRDLIDRNDAKLFNIA